MIVDAVWDPYLPTHIALQGQTRSGKSVLTYGLLGPLAGRLEVDVCGLDPTGVLLRPWVESGSSDAAVPIDAGDQPVYRYFLNVLSRITKEMDYRNTRILPDLQKDKLDPEDFDADRPLKIVVFEEYPGLLRAAASEDVVEGRKPGERVAPLIEAGVNRLVSEGAKAGVRVILLGQRLSAKALDTDARSNFGVRVTMRVDNADAIRMLHDNAADWASIVSRFEPGEGIVERPGHGPRRFKADYVSYQDYCAWVSEAADRPVTKESE